MTVQSCVQPARLLILHPLKRWLHSGAPPPRAQFCNHRDSERESW